MRARLEYQAGHAIVWRDAIVQYFLKLSGIPDERGRAGHYPRRFEAEDARLVGYTVIDVTPWEDASGGKAATCGGTNCSAEWTYSGSTGRFNIAVQYFDLQRGVAKFAVSINGQPARSEDASWAADANLPSARPNGDNSTRHIVRGVTLKPGDVIRVEGIPDDADPAALDYIEILPAPQAQ
jgi:alpha-glucuronidase